MQVAIERLHYLSTTTRLPSPPKVGVGDGNVQCVLDNKNQQEQLGLFTNHTHRRIRQLLNSPN